MNSNDETRQERTPYQRFHSPILGWPLTVLGRLMIAACLIAWLVIIFSSNIERQQAGLPISLFPGLVPVLIFVVVGTLAIGMIRLGKKLKSISGERLLAKDQRSPVVYLRSFQDDGSENLGLPGGMSSPLEAWGLKLESLTEEEDLARAFKRVGPFVAIGNPDEKLPELGAARLYVSDSDWQDKVTDLVAEAKLVILRAGTTKGFLWELKNVVEHCQPHRVLIYLPQMFSVGKKKPDKQQIEFWQEFREAASECLPDPLPENLNGSRFISFSGNWEPQPIKPLTAAQQSFGRSVTGSVNLNLQRELSPVLANVGVKVAGAKHPVVMLMKTIAIVVALLVGLPLLVILVLSSI